MCFEKAVGSRHIPDVHFSNELAKDGFKCLEIRTTILENLVLPSFKMTCFCLTLTGMVVLHLKNLFKN